MVFSPPQGESWEFLVGVCLPVLQILTLFQTKKMSFFTPIFRSKIHTHFQTCPWAEIMLWITWIKAQTKKFFKCILNLHISLLLLFTWS